MRSVGLVVDGPPVAWMARAAELAASVAAVHVFVLPESRSGSHAFAGYAALDRRLCPSTPDAFAATELPHAVPVEDEHELKEKASGLDVLVDLTARGLDPSVVPGSELWTLRHGGVACGASHAVFREFAAGTQTCVSTLIRRGRNGDEVLYRSRSFVRRLSLNRARNPIYWKSAAFVARVLQPGLAVPVSEEAPLDRREPSLGEMAALQAALVQRLAAFLRERLLHQPSWSIDWRAGDRRAGSSAEFVPSGRLEAPKGQFYADPFVVDHAGRDYLFYEAYRHARGRADLAVSELSDGRLGPSTTILSKPYHLSYPFVFRWRDDHFLLPESADSGLVQLYRAVDFPGEWTIDSTLLEGVRAYDSTLVEHDGRYFLFAAIPEPGADIDELHLFWADDLRGPYRPHPQNPVVSDVARARPGGRVFHDAGRLIRPSQDGSRGYGSAIVLNEIVELGVASYAERPAGRIEAAWDARARGTHTIDHDGRVEVVDVKLLQPRFALRREKR